MGSRPFRRSPAFRCVLALAFSLSAIACAGDSRKLPVRSLSIQRGDGSAVAIETEIAANDEDRRRGLMNRTALAEGKGMLFVFDRDQRLAFWMKDTLIPLSIAYIASDGKILEIHSMKPLDRTPVESERSARYALEVPQGWFDRAGIVLGDRLDVQRLSAD